MRKKIVLLAFLSCVVTSSFALAYTGYGVCEFGKETVNNAKCFGPTKLAQTTVKGTVTVAGPLQASDSMMDGVDVKGMARMTGSNVAGNTTIAGVLAADHSKFAGDLLITSGKALFSASLIKGSITMESLHRTPMLELRCGTKVTGDVIFKGMSGVIKKSADSIVSGKVTNGTIEALADDGKCS